MAKLSFSPYLPNSPVSKSFMGPLIASFLSALPRCNCGKIVIFAIFAKFAAFANFYGAPVLLFALPRLRLWQNCHFRHIRQIRRFRQLLWGPFTALCFASLAIVAKLSFSPYFPNSPLSPTFVGYLHCFVLCLVGDCGKIVIFAICAKFAAFANLYGAPSLLCALPLWGLWQNCHFRHICQIRRLRQLLCCPYTALCFASLAIVAKLSFSPYLPNSPLSPTFIFPLYCFVVCLVGDCGKIVIFAIFSKFAAFANVYGPRSLLSLFPRWGLWEKCHSHHISQIRRFRELLWGPFTALCFASLATVAKLSFSPYLPNSPLSPTFMGPLYCFVLCLVGDCGKIVIFVIFAKFASFANFYGAPSLLCSLLRWRLWQNCHFRHICQIRLFRNLLWAPFTALCFASLAIVAKLSFSPYLPNSPLSPTFVGYVHFFVLCLVGDCGKIVIFAIFAKFACFEIFYGPFMGPLIASFLSALPRCNCGKIVIFAIFAKFASFANFCGPPSLLCSLPRWRLWQNCHFRHIRQFRRFRQLLWGPFTALCFASLAIVAKLSFSPYLPNSPLSPTFMAPLYCFVLCLVGDCGKIVIFAIFSKFAAFANVYGPRSLLSLFPRWGLWQKCHFRHICQIRRFRQLLWGPFTALCFASLATVAKLSFSPYLPNSPLSPTFMAPLYCFVLCLVGDCGKIDIFVIFAKFASFANFYGAPSLLCSLPRWRLWQNCHFRHIRQIRRFRQLLWGPHTALCFTLLAIVAKLSFSPYLPNLPLWQLLWGPFTALCFASLAIVAKLSFSPYLPNSPLSPTFMGPLHCFVLCLFGDCGKIVIFAIFAKFGAFANFYGAPILLFALPRWRLWQNCHFRHISQIRLFRQLLWAPFTALCLASLAIVAKLSFSPYFPNSPLSQTFVGLLHCFVLCLVGDCGKIVIFAIFAKFACFEIFYGPPHCFIPFCFASLQLWQNCHFRHICQIRLVRQLLWAPFTALFFASLAIVAKLSFSLYSPISPLSPTFMGPLHCFVLCLFGDCGKIVIFAIFAKFAAFANFYGAPILPCALPRWRLWQNCHFRHISQIRLFRQLLWAPFTAWCFASLAIVAKLSFSPYFPNSPLSPTFVGPLHCFVLCLVGDCGKIVIFAIFAKFACFEIFYGPPHCFIPFCFASLQLWQNCHFRHISQIRLFR